MFFSSLSQLKWNLKEKNNELWRVYCLVFCKLTTLSLRIYNYYLFSEWCGLVVGICNPNFLYSSDL